MDTENITNEHDAPATPTDPLILCSMIQTPDENGSMRNTLNDDCMVEFFKLVQTSDLILISCFCEHCFDLIKSRIFPYREINIDDIFKVYDIREFFAQFGSEISDLTIHRRHIEDKSTTKKAKSDSQELLEILTLNCANDSLKKLDISLNFHDIDTPCIVAFASKLQNMRDLTITASNYNSSQRTVNRQENDHKLEILLQKVNQLKTIQINAMSIGGDFLHRTSIKHLTELALVQCDRIQMDALVESAAHFKCLTKFLWKNSKFNGTQSVSDNIATVCNILGREFETLREVTVHMNYGQKYCNNNGEQSILNGLKQLPHLKSLSIGLAGACACNDFYGVIPQLEQLKSLAIESPLSLGGRNCLPCEKIIRNYLPKIFDKLRNLTSLRIVRVYPERIEHLTDEIVDKLKHIDELQLIGIRQFNGENLLSLVRDIPKLKMISLNETRFDFTRELYLDLVNECQNRHLKILVRETVRHTILARVAKQYRKECVQIIAVD